MICQFYNEASDLQYVQQAFALCGGSEPIYFGFASAARCAGCGLDFSKFYLRQNLFIEIRGLPT
jgi:hypothetical protein